VKSAHLSSCRVVGVALLLVACGGSTPDPVAPPPSGTDIASVTVTPGTQSVAALGVTVPLTAEVRNGRNEVVQGQLIAWTRRGTGAVLVNSSGVVTTVANGTDTVVATTDGKSGLTVITVQQVPAAITLTTNNANLTILGGSAAVTGALRDANNRTIVGASITWSSSNPTALPVSATGVVTAARIGSAEITATAGALSAKINISVQLSSPVGGPLLGTEIPCQGGAAGPFPCQGVNLLSFLPVGGLGGGQGVTLNDLWGWTDPVSGKEIAIVMRRDGTAFVDLSDPLRPEFLGFMPITPGATPNVWHDVKVYKDHAFIVADGAGPHGMQVFDLRRLRDHAGVPRTFAPNTTYTQINSAHNIAINEASGYAYIVGASSGGTTCGGGLHIVDIRTPGTPTFAGCFADPFTGRAGTGYSHDVQCVNYKGPDAARAGREICFGSNETHLSIADVTSKASPIAISRATYPQVAYTHQGWLTEDQRYFLINDELDEQQFGASGTRTLVWDVADLDDPVLVGQYFGPTPATDHNHYIRGTRMYSSNYQFGMRVVNVGNPLAPTQAGFFDTAPNLANVPGFGGSWSNYPYFASGIIVVTSQGEGLFVLRMP
jgi:choice-of-anchor B domain-containing protein